MTITPDDRWLERLAEAIRGGTPEEMAAELWPHVRAYGDERAVHALTDAADDWQRRAWAGTPRRADRVADRIGAAQYVTDWLRVRVTALQSE